MRTLRGALLTVPLLATIACVDPVHDSAVEKLGGEAPGVHVGPLHRAGQPCLTCHGGQGPADAEFSVAGTVYLLQFEDTPAPNTSVILEDINGAAVMIGTNEVGNFYINASDWRPTYPMTAKLVFSGKVNRPMNTTISRSGSCGDCHTNSPNQTSAGRVYVANNMTQLTKALAAP
jgi:hypothetical protein